MKYLKGIHDFLTELIGEWNSDKAAMLAAALAYYAVFSLGPMLLIVIWVSGLAFGEAAVEGRVVGEISGLVGKDGAVFIQDMIKNARETSGDTIASIVGFVTLIISSAALIRHLQTAINVIWDVETPPQRGGVVYKILNTVQDRFFSFAMVLGVGFLLMVALVISAGVGALNDYLENLLPQTYGIVVLINQAVSLLIFTGLFALIYKVLPDAKVEWRDVLVGSFFAAVLFNVGKYILGVYLGNSDFGSTYGAAGALVLLLAWIYYSSQILLVGAEFTQVFARRYGSQIVSVGIVQNPVDKLTDHVEPQEVEDEVEKPMPQIDPVRTRRPRFWASSWQKQKALRAQKMLAGLIGFVATMSAFIFVRKT